jgi:hypothetical protein
MLVARPFFFFDKRSQPILDDLPMDDLDGSNDIFGEGLPLENNIHQIMMILVFRSWLFTLNNK